MRQRDKKKTVIFLSLLLFVLAGCGTYVNYIPADAQPTVSSQEDIKILSQHPEKPYKVLGQVEAQGSYESEVLGALKRKAYEIGAEALIDVTYKKLAREQKRAPGNFASSELLWDIPSRKINQFFASFSISGTAIKYTEQ